MIAVREKDQAVRAGVQILKSADRFRRGRRGRLFFDPSGVAV